MVVADVSREDDCREPRRRLPRAPRPGGRAPPQRRHRHRRRLGREPRHRRPGSGSCGSTRAAPRCWPRRWCRRCATRAAARSPTSRRSPPSAPPPRGLGNPPLAYKMSKAALNALTQSLAQNYAGDGHPREHDHARPDRHPDGGRRRGARVRARPRSLRRGAQRGRAAQGRDGQRLGRRQRRGLPRLRGGSLHHRRPAAGRRGTIRAGSDETCACSRSRRCSRCGAAPAAARDPQLLDTEQPVAPPAGADLAHLRPRRADEGAHPAPGRIRDAAPSAATRCSTCCTAPAATGPRGPPRARPRRSRRSFR